MTELIRQYESDIEQIRGRITVLKVRCRARSYEEDDSLRERIGLLEEEVRELMYSLALMRRTMEPKPVNPSFAALMAEAAGDAAC